MRWTARATSAKSFDMIEDNSQSIPSKDERYMIYIEYTMFCLMQNWVILCQRS